MAGGQETIFVQTDPAFNLVLNSLNELRNQNRLVVTYFKTASIQNIQSNQEGEDRRFLFGSANESCVQMFARTASSVLRMCMLKATNVDAVFWPTMGPRSQRRNMANLVSEVLMDGNFHLADNRRDARRYWSRYDHQYPHFLIEETMDFVGANNQAHLPSMMLIFRGNMTEVIEITTTFTATRNNEPTNQFDSYVHVCCIVRSICNGDQSEDGRFTKQLKELMRPTFIKSSYYTSIRDAKTKDDLPDALEHLQLEELQKESEDNSTKTSAAAAATARSKEK